MKSVFGLMWLGWGSPSPRSPAGRCGQGRTRLMMFPMVAQAAWKKTRLYIAPVLPCVLG